MALDLGREALLLTLLVAAPLLLVGMVVGVMISIFQAVTQIQEMTLTFVPKIVAMVLAGILLMPWILGKMTMYAQHMFGPLPLP
jgi:flagellar biosynthetic protein FliQ